MSSIVCDFLCFLWEDSIYLAGEAGEAIDGVWSWRLSQLYNTLELVSLLGHMCALLA